MNGQPDQPDTEQGQVEPETAEPAVAEQSAEATDPGSKLEDVQRKADENWDRYLRAAAEVENIRKRAARDVENAHKFALEGFARELLGVRDSLEMGLAAAESAEASSLREGSEATLKLLTTALERFGIRTVGELRLVSRELLFASFGRDGLVIHERARGRDATAIDANCELDEENQAQKNQDFCPALDSVIADSLAFSIGRSSTTFSALCIAKSRLPVVW